MGPEPVFYNCSGQVCINSEALDQWTKYYLKLIRWAADTEQLCKGD
jgi:hypothetical protein